MKSTLAGQELRKGACKICILCNSCKAESRATGFCEAWVWRNLGKSMPVVLLADDNPSDVYLIREALREHSVDCVLRVVSDGRAALGVVSGETADTDIGSLGLIILDLNLPRHDGIEILQKLRESVGVRAHPRRGAYVVGLAARPGSGESTGSHAVPAKTLQPG